ncbi:MAG TPA: fibronectin type III domain-containing protein [Verrucomicrobiae bacterium]|nr:fibronectin type III domain-containing protein [Verrucomicrobiae bacterium]
MSVARFNLGWVLVILMLGSEWSHAQIRRETPARATRQANTLTIVWRPSPSPEVIGYALYWGLSADSCTNRVDLGNVTNVTLVGFQRRLTYHFAVAGYDASGEESPWSNQIQYSRPRTIPTLTLTNRLQLQHVNLTSTNPVLRLSFMGQADVSYQIETTQDFQRWDVLCITNCAQEQLVVYDLPYHPDSPHRFFRLRPELE